MDDTPPEKQPAHQTATSEAPLPTSPAAVLAFLDSLGIATSTVEHAPVFTVAESKATGRPMDGGHVKNLFLKDKKSRLFCVTVLESAVIDLKRLHERIGGSGRLSFAGPDVLFARWGVRPGSVTPLGAINDTGKAVTVVLDAAMMALPRLNMHPLVNTMSTAMASGDLVRFLEATGHTPLIVPLSA